MNRKLKALGLAFAAVMAMAAFSASTASADFDSESTHTIISASQPAEINDVFTTNAGTVTCNTATYSGTQTGTTATEITVVPNYQNCTAFGFVNAPIDVNGCGYVFTTTTTPTPHTAIRLHIECPTGKSLEVTAFNCHVSVPPQTLAGITYTNQGAGATRDVYVHANITGGMTYTQTSKAFPGCTGGNGTFNNGTYKGAATVTGADTNGNHVGIWTTHTL